MKIWKLQILWGEEKHRTVLRFDRNISRLDVERITKYVNGGFHIHANPKRKLLQYTDPPKIEEESCQPETCAGQCQGMNSREECPNLLKMEEELAPPKEEKEK